MGAYGHVKDETVAQLILRYLKLEGVFTLFGIPGGGVAHIIDELKNQRDRFDYVICRHETGAAYMADGYARVTGRLGVVLVTTGPGATNALTGAMNALNGGVPLLALTGEVAEQYFGRGYLQEGTDDTLNVNAVYRAATGFSALITSPSNFQTLFAQALRDALSLPHQAVHVSVPDDVAGTVVADARMPAEVANYRAVPECSSPHQLQRAFELLNGARFPLILLGNGARRVLTGERLRMFTAVVEKFAIPVMTTPDAKAIFPESHRLSLRTYGIAACEWPRYYLQPHLIDPELPQRYDALCVLGSTLGELATSKWDPMLIPHGPFIQVDLDPSVIARALPVDLGIVAEIGATLTDLFEVADRTPPDPVRVADRCKLVERVKQRSPWVAPEKRSSDAVPILPQRMVKCINDALPAGSVVFLDAGNCVGWGLHYLQIDPPSVVHSALAMGPMGFGVAGVIGAKRGAPGRTCLGIVGDGAFLMHGTEVSTAAAYGIGAILVVLWDDDLAMVSQGMAHLYPDPSGVWNHYYSLGKPDLPMLARALGADAYDVSTPAEMTSALADAIRKADALRRPQVIAVRIDRTQVPPYYPAKSSG